MSDGGGGKRVRTEGVSLDWRNPAVQLSDDPEARKRAEEKANKAKLKGKSGKQAALFRARYSLCLLCQENLCLEIVQERDGCQFRSLAFSPVPRLPVLQGVASSTKSKERWPRPSSMLWPDAPLPLV